MRNTDTPSILDWIAISLRWLTLLSLSVSLATQEKFSIYLTAIFLLAALWNFSLTVLVALNRRLGGMRVLMVAADLLIASLLFLFSGALNGPLGWSGILPIFSAALYFETRGLVIIALLSMLTLGGQAFFFSDPMTVFVYMGGVGLLYLVIGFLLSSLGRSIADIMLCNQRERLAVRQEAERIDNERRRAIYDLISALTATLNYQRVLETALDLSVTAVSTPAAPATNMVSAVLLYSENEAGEPRLQVGSSRRFPPADMRIEVPGTTGLIGRAINDAEARITKDVTKDPELGRFIALRACTSACCIPLRNGLDTYGVLLFAHPEEDFFTPERRETLEIIANQASIAIQNARLYHDLESEKERMMEIQEEASRKLARDLHDGPTQSVAAIAMRVNFARRLLERDSKAASEELYKVEDLARRTTKEIRHMLFTLRPLVLESQGLVAALDSMAEKLRETFNQEVIIEADPGVIKMLGMNKQAVIFNIAEEAVNNARKYAQAEHIWVRLKPLANDVALLEIKDDGVGFNLENINAAYESRGSLGMVNMRERAELVNGLMSIESAEGRGTRVQVVIPLNEEASDRIRRGL